MSSDPIDIRQDAEQTGVPEAEIPWENTVRRFTGSIDVRLDILEDELGGLQDELNRLQQVAGERIDAAQRRLLRVYLAGQVLLGGLIVGLFLMVWPVVGTDADRQPAPAASAKAPHADVESGSGNRLPGIMQAPVSETATPTETRTASPRPRTPKAPESGAGASSQASSPTGTDAAAEGEKKTAAPEEPQEKSAAEPASAPSLVEDKEPSVTTQGQPTATPTIGGADAPESDRATPAASQQSSRPEELREQGGPPDGSKAEAVASTGDEASSSGQKDAATLLEEERFAIQLVTYHSESRVADFAEEFGIASNARYMVSQDGGQDWYSVFLGVYTSRSEATAAAESLPKKLRELNPWVRSLPAGTRLMPTSASADTPPEG